MYKETRLRKSVNRIAGRIVAGEDMVEEKSLKPIPVVPDDPHSKSRKFCSFLNVLPIHQLTTLSIQIVTHNAAKTK